MLDRTTFLLSSIASITITSVLGTTTPLIMKQRGWVSTAVIEALSFFTGGIFLGAGMLHMLPEAVREADRVQITGLWNPFSLFAVGYLVCS
jgi:hypothetical protein